MNSIYIIFRGKIYKQVMGIPMGCDCAPKVADLFLLYKYEHDNISKVFTNLNSCQLFRKTRKFKFYHLNQLKININSSN